MIAIAIVVVLIIVAVVWLVRRGESPAAGKCDGVQCPGGSCDPATGLCVCGSGRCPAGWICADGSCLIPAQPVCPDGTTFDPSSGYCLIPANPTCPDGFNYNPATGNCLIPAHTACPDGAVYDPATGNCTMPAPSCPALPCVPPFTCDTTSGQCVAPSAGTCPGGVDMMSAQPHDSVQIINNTSEAPFHVFVEFANFNPGGGGAPTLAPPPTPWSIISGSPGVTISAPKSYYPATNYPPGATPPFFSPNAIGSATWQEIVMPQQGDTVLLSIPQFHPNQAWSIRPLKYYGAGGDVACNSSEGDCGMPILIEAGRDMVGDMSAVDGVNFLLCYQFTTRGGVSSLMDFKTNPCRATGQNPKGCRNPSVDGVFKASLVGTPACLPGGSEHCWLSAPCPAGTCNLDGTSRAWCDAINDGQCSNSSSTWDSSGQSGGGPKSCSDHNLFTTYCYSHNDAPSSPYIGAPYKLKLVYSDLA